MKIDVTLTYRVTVPDQHQVHAWKALVDEYVEENEGVAPEDLTEDEIAYWLIEKSHGGDHVSAVELLHDSCDIASDL